ncbi:hypothetical protein [Flavobacterium chilense]|uniref:Uncharacterized protein n=1 Tax=Flavobacterium chilense TaxID=946677 RepID=A0A1M7HWM8_9FLAO|nr:MULTISPECIES: hypothetical protein [Flavobacterium]SHM32894.1 hypothetical protein SAMN05444484_105165 [Flavobacterium chilense]
METALFLAMGWCGTRYPGWWKRFWKNPPPPPDPEPWWTVTLIGIGLIAGAAGGLFFSNAIAENQFFAGQNAVASGLFAYGASNIVTGITTAFRN